MNVGAPLTSGHEPCSVTRIEVGAVRARALVAGPADAEEAVVFVHGNPGSADDWSELVTAAGHGGRAVALDLPGFGETEAPPGFEHTVPSYAGFLADALQTLGIGRVHLVLHDFGGPIGLAWAGANADAVASMTLIAAGALPGFRWHRLAKIWRTPVLGEIFQALSTRRAFRYVIERPEPRGLPRAFVDRMYDHYDRRTKRAVLDLYRSTDDPDRLAAEATAVFRPLDPPTLVVWGRHDTYIPSAYADRQREAFPSAEIHVLDESGHWPFVDASQTVRQLLLSFLARHRPADGKSGP